jgi:hypothetical protein
VAATLPWTPALVAAVGLFALPSGCWRGAPEPGAPRTLACYSRTQNEVTCVEQPLLLKDDHHYVIVSCGQSEGRIVEACPEKERIGICERPANLPTERGFELRTVRVHHYLPPDRATPAAIADYPQAHCGVGTWTYTLGPRP